MTTYIGSIEAASILGVSPSTLYAYVSRGRISRRTAADGRSSLFPLDEVEALARRSRHAPRGPRPSIDVRISSTITELDEDGVHLRGHDLADLARNHRFEDVAELLWTGTLARAEEWPAAAPADRRTLETIRLTPDVDPIARLAMASLRFDALHRDDDAAVAARRLLSVSPTLLGSKRRTGPFAHRLAAAWKPAPQPALVAAIDGALVLLADHELATSTLGVRVAASVRASPYGAFTAGLATVQGALHGSASDYAHRFFVRCAETTAEEEVANLRRRRERVPGFGHKVYRGPDPRFEVLFGRVRELAGESADAGAKLDVVDAVIVEVGRTIPKYPNIDLALGALTWIGGLEPTVPIFAVARIAGWAAHYAEELEAPPVRFRGIASPR
jgi:citrate synthase